MVTKDTAVSSRGLLDTIFSRLEQKITDPHERIDRVFHLSQELKKLVNPRPNCGNAMAATLRQRIEHHLSAVTSLQGASSYSATDVSMLCTELDLVEIDMLIAARLVDYLDLNEQVHSLKQRFGLLCDEVQGLDDRELAAAANKMLEISARIIDELEQVIAFVGGDSRSQLREYNRGLTQMGLTLAESGLDLAARVLARG